MRASHPALRLVPLGCNLISEQGAHLSFLAGTPAALRAAFGAVGAFELRLLIWGEEEPQPRTRRGAGVWAARKFGAMRTLVTGGAGFIGSSLVDRLLSDGHEVDVLDDFSTGSTRNLADARATGGQALTVHELDVRLPEATELIVRRRPDVVFHLAAQIDVRVSVADPVFDADVNVLGSLRVLEGARAAGSGRVVFAASGGTLYGDVEPSELPVPESHPHRPLSPYGVSKKAVLDYLSTYRELHSLEFCALALANVYGPRQDAHGEAGVVAIFADTIARGEPVTIYGEGSQTRDFVYVGDVVDAFVRAATKGGGLVCNIGTGVATSVSELHRTMAEVAGVAARARHAPARPGEIMHSALDPGRAAIHLGWRPSTTLAEGSAPVIRLARAALAR